jgi:YspA, cpYpsA-related SLOG family
MTAHRVLVTGSREWSDRGTVARAFADVHRNHGDVVLVHGMERGTDRVASQIARSLGWSVEAYPADLFAHDDGCPEYHFLDRTICDLARGRRNQKMVDLGVDQCFAFNMDDWLNASDCVKRATVARVPVTTINL